MIGKELIFDYWGKVVRGTVSYVTPYNYWCTINVNGYMLTCIVPKRCVIME